MRRAVLGVVGLLLPAAGCGHDTVAEIVPATAITATPEVTTEPFVVTAEDVTERPDVCGLVRGERMGRIFGVTGVASRDASLPHHGSQVGACEYHGPEFTLTVEAFLVFDGDAPAEFVMAALDGAGRRLDGLGDAPTGSRRRPGRPCRSWTPSGRQPARVVASPGDTQKHRSISEVVRRACGSFPPLSGTRLRASG